MKNRKKNEERKNYELCTGFLPSLKIRSFCFILKVIWGKIYSSK
jgi:hypothetical protein